MMPKTLDYIATLEVVTCGVCGVPHAIPAELHQNARRLGTAWYCPSGHQIGYRNTEMKRLQTELDKQKIRLSQTEARAREELSLRLQAEASLTATKGVVTRLKRRVGNGVCPCCGRSFQALGRHMKSQHPGWSEEDS